MIIKKKSEKEPKVDSVFGIKSVQIEHKTIVPQIVDKFAGLMIIANMYELRSTEPKLWPMGQAV